MSGHVWTCLGMSRHFLPSLSLSGLACNCLGVFWLGFSGFIRDCMGLPWLVWVCLNLSGRVVDHLGMPELV